MRLTRSAIATRSRVRQAAEATRARGLSGLAEAAARNLFKLMAYKDEYEVARLYTDGTFCKKLRRQFEGDFTLEYHLAPPLFAPARSGQPASRASAPSDLGCVHVFRFLARLRRAARHGFRYFRLHQGAAHGAALDRRIRSDPSRACRRRSLPTITRSPVEIASLPAKMRGFGHVKARNVESAKACEAELSAAAQQGLVRFCGIRLRPERRPNRLGLVRRHRRQKRARMGMLRIGKNLLDRHPASTISPRYITSTRLHRWRTTDRS